MGDEWLCRRMNMRTGMVASFPFLHNLATSRAQELTVYLGIPEQFTFKEYEAKPLAYSGAPPPPLVLQPNLGQRQGLDVSLEALENADDMQDETTLDDSRSSSSVDPIEEPSSEEDVQSTQSNEDSIAAKSEATTRPHDSGYGSGPVSVQTGPSSVYSHSTSKLDNVPAMAKPADPPPMQAVTAELKSRLEENAPHSVIFQTNSLAHDFHRQVCDENMKLGKVWTVTGTAGEAIATTCEEYMKQTWSHHNPCDLLDLIEMGMRDGKASGKSKHLS
jgi:hypothetical protein